jgi:hypothetical protein
MFHPAGFGIELFMFKLMRSGDLTVVIEKNKTGTGGSLIDGTYVFFLHDSSC